MAKVVLLILSVLLTVCKVRCCDYAHTSDWNITYTESQYIFNAPLDKLYSIDKLQNIRNAYVLTINENNIDTLCSGTIANFPNLVLLELINSNIHDIQPGAFTNISSDLVLHLDTNKLTAIRTGVFTGLKIASLYLDNNQISVIEPDAFDNMPNLEVLSLNLNSISKWNSNWFKETPCLTYLYFNDNKIETLPANALKNIAMHTTNRSTLSLEHNRIHDIHPEAFKGVKNFGKIVLTGNRLTTLPPNILKDIESLTILNLVRNKLSCLSDEVLISTKNVRVVKLENNPLDDSCASRVQRINETVHINVYLYHTTMTWW